MTKPYPGLRTIFKKTNTEIILWEIVPFDNVTKGKIGQISNCFYTNEFLVNCSQGRVLVRDWEAINDKWQPIPNMILISKKFSEQMERIIKRHELKHKKNQPISPRILNFGKSVF